jgi:hypothetical protein
MVSLEDTRMYISSGKMSLLQFMAACATSSVFDLQ